MTELGRYLRYAVREAASQRGFTAIAVATLALGIGANTAIFSVVDTIILRQLPYPDSDRLVMLWKRAPARGEEQGFVSYPDFRDWKEQSESFQDMVAFWAFANGNVNLTGGLEPERVPVARVSRGYFEVLGVSPAVGRTFHPDENIVGNHRVAILSYGLWQRQFGGDPALVGGNVFVNGFPYAVVGIMPQGFQPVGSLALGDDVELWRPLAPNDNQTGGRASRNLRIIGRLAEGATLQQAQAEMDGIAARLALEYPETNEGTAVRVIPLQEQIVQDVRPALLMLLGAVALVLLIAATNVANLLLVRAAARNKQIAIRVALGAPRSRIVMQLLSESVVLGVSGGALGLLLAFFGVNVLVEFGPSDIPLLSGVVIDHRVLVFTLIVSLITGILFGLVPAVQFSKPNLTQSLKDGGGRTVGGMDRRMADALVISEIGLALLLVIGAGLLVRSFQQLMRVDPGFDVENVLTMQLELPMVTKYPEQEQRNQFFEELLARIQALPGVNSTTMTNAPPMGEGGFDTPFTIRGKDEPSDGRERIGDVRLIDPAYFRTMDIPFITGRAFTSADRDDAPRVAVINQSMARQLFPDGNAIGWFVRLGFGAEAEIVGVVGDVRDNGLDNEVQPTIYWPSRQMRYNFMTVVVRTSGDPNTFIKTAREEIRAMDAEQPVYNIVTLRDLVSRSVARRRFQMFLLAGFSALALVLAMVGIYGVVSYSVSERTNEIGIRMALGAQTNDALMLVLRRSARLTLLGLAIGLGAAVALHRLMSSFLFQVETLDIWTYGASAGALGAVALLATYVPARRAARVDPLIALRTE